MLRVQPVPTSADWLNPEHSLPWGEEALSSEEGCVGLAGPGHSPGTGPGSCAPRLT